MAQLVKDFVLGVVAHDSAKCCTAILYLIGPWLRILNAIEGISDAMESAVAELLDMRSAPRIGRVGCRDIP